MWYMHTMKYYSATERKEILIVTYVTTWMDLENMLSAISQTEDKCSMFPLI